MSDFNTHGGYFAPKGYFKVNEGGSHEENPNGGVQIGMDPQGVPNLLEEGEPVYNDYVYSDNIYADGGILEQNNIPVKYAGKLYSDIVDKLFKEMEVEGNELDNISHNGLDVMLTRLANAQEQQKQEEEKKRQEEEFTNELSELSPEELDQLEMMLAQEEQIPQEEIVPEEQVGPAMPVEGAPMMANGGFIRRFDEGGPKKNMEDDVESILASLAESNAARAEYDEAKKNLQQAQGNLWRRKAGDYLFRMNDRMLNSAISAQENNLLQKYQDLAENEGGIYNDPNSPYSKRMATAIRQTANGLRKLRDKKTDIDARIAIEERNVADAEKSLDDAYLRYKGITNGFPSISVEAPYIGYGEDEDVVMNFDDEPNGLAVSRDTAIVKPSSSFGIDSIITPDGYDENSFPFKYGGKVNRFDFGDFLRRVQGYKPSTYRGGISGTYAIDRGFDLGKYKTIEDLEQSEAYDAFTKYVMRNSNDPNVKAYLQALDKGINQDNGVPLLFDANGNLVDNWKDLYYQRRYDQTPGIYHLNPDEIYALGAYQPRSIIDVNGTFLNHGANTDDWNPARAWNMMSAINPAQAYAARSLAKNEPQDGIVGNTPNVSPDVISGNADGVIDSPVSYKGNDEYAPGYLPTWPRFAGAIGSGLLGLYNVFQPADRYDIPNATPYLPEGRINLQNQVYNPIDQNMVANAQIAQGNATNRALRNSGLGPSSAAAILAADNNVTGNLGTGFIQAWDANNQRRNAVLAANNQAEAQRAQFDYTVDAARKNIINATQRQNLQNQLYQQMMNNQAEGDKYTAISNQINSGLQALSAIGRENFAANQLRSNPAMLGYYPDANGVMRRIPQFDCFGGFLKKLKK